MPITRATSGQKDSINILTLALEWETSIMLVTASDVSIRKVVRFDMQHFTHITFTLSIAYNLLQSKHHSISFPYIEDKFYSSSLFLVVWNVSTRSWIRYILRDTCSKSWAPLHGNFVFRKEWYFTYLESLRLLYFLFSLWFIYYKILIIYCCV